MPEHGSWSRPPRPITDLLMHMRARIDRLSRPPTALAALAFVIGVIDIVSALTPELAQRVHVLDRVLTINEQMAARGLTLAAGVALLLLASSLSRRKHRAWVLAVALVSVSVVLHIAKGLDIEESLANLTLLALLIRSRRWFDAPGDPASWRLILGITGLLSWLLVSVL